MVVDLTVSDQRYVEDCEVCCHPIDVVVGVDRDGSVRVEARRAP